MTDRNPLYRRHRFPAEIVANAVWLHFRFPLSLRMLEDMLAGRGIVVSHQTVRQWAEKFGRAFASEMRRRSADRLGDKCGTLMRRPFRSAARSIGSGVLSIRTVSSWRLWCKVVAMPRRPSV
jgi:hypothetical protein